MEFSVLSYNVRYVLDRWRERMPMVKDIIRGEEKPHDIVGLQEVLLGGHRFGFNVEFGKSVDRLEFENTGPCFPSYMIRIPLIGWLLMLVWESPLGLLFRDLYAWFNAAFLEMILGQHGAFIFHTPILGDLVYLLLGSAWSFGNLMGVNKQFETEYHPPLLLGGKYRIAQLAVVRIPRPDGSHLKTYVINTHLSDTPGFPSEQVLAKCQENRLSEFLRIVSWVKQSGMDEEKDAIIVMGDMNSTPNEKMHDVAKEMGFKSAYKEIHGEEPAITFHQKHDCVTKDLGDEECLDYIFFRGPIQVKAANLVGDSPHAQDKTLYPSDHFGISATFTVM